MNLVYTNYLNLMSPGFILFAAIATTTGGLVIVVVLVATVLKVATRGAKRLKVGHFLKGSQIVLLSSRFFVSRIDPPLLPFGRLSLDMVPAVAIKLLLEDDLEYSLALVDVVEVIGVSIEVVLVAVEEPM